MSHYEYKVIAAPNHAERVRGAKTTADRFAQTLGAVLNEMGAEGWEYQRAESLPCEERKGLTGKATHTQHVLIFRRAVQPVPVWAETVVDDEGADEA
ncbi:DUF4177 domain-containing protein [Actibacterium sp. XHP0104]|uniref:DUF4177 domain-containing protein n=1 Tax=Actibacterium sp. XHP0104 TaxID=2984335 RepID=UPI0021E8C60B|nr:DUF4177 domain-containing protein [Actibacterium sp. XHP0104]MCV2881353.1 DUF4177 domain-containing protein [Actibacterium sp. XHP0104]